ncbi:hypothetical protein DYGSA30_25830 [Dyella sp. GSA-30]|nr:hypothetical protein DYGSA30_25830 [Dyella sp. GSA-30]
MQMIQAMIGNQHDRQAQSLGGGQKTLGNGGMPDVRKDDKRGNIHNQLRLVGD